MLSLETLNTNSPQLSATIDGRNFAPHTASGDGVIRVLPFASSDIRQIMERGFERFFGLAPVN